MPTDELAALLSYFREGGRDNLRALLRRLARHAGAALDCAAPQVLPRTGGYTPEEQAVDLDRLLSTLPQGRPVIPIVFYRSMLLAADVAPIDALCEALAARRLAPAPLFVTSLKDSELAAFLRAAMPRLEPKLIVTTTAFAAAGGADELTPLDEAGVPRAASRRRHYQARCLGRVARAGSALPTLPCMSCCPNWTAVYSRASLLSRARQNLLDGLAFTGVTNQPEPDRVDAVADRIAALVHLQVTPRSRRRIAVLMPDYPGAPGRTGYAVGLDVPASVNGLLDDLADAGYTVADTPMSSKALLDALAGGGVSMSMSSIATFCRPFRWMSAKRSGRRGARRRTIPISKMARFASAQEVTAMSSWPCRLIVAILTAGVWTITMRRCRRATRCSPSDCGCVTPPASMLRSIWAPMAHWNGCRGRPSH